MTNNIKSKRLSIYIQYRTLYNQNDAITTRILNGNNNTLNLIYNKYIKNAKISPKAFFQTLIESSIFRKSLYADQTLILSTQITKYLRKSFNNNIKTKKFQELIDSIDVYLSQSKSINLNKHMRELVHDKYYFMPKVSFIKQKQTNLVYTQANIHEIRELMDWISLIQYHYNLEQNAHRNQTILLRINDKFFLESLYQRFLIFLSENNYAHTIYKELGGDVITIKNTQLHNEINHLINQNTIDTYNIDYGYNQSDKYDARNRYSSNALPSVISGELQREYKHYATHSVLLYTYRDAINTDDVKIKGFKAMKNLIFNNAQTTLIDSGYNPARQTSKYYVIYTYNISRDQLKILNILANNTMNYLDRIKTTEFNTDLQNYHKCTYTFNYEEQGYKTRRFNAYCKHLGVEGLHYTHIFYPVNDRIQIPNCFAHKSWWVDQNDQMRFKGGNIERKPITTHLNKDIQRIFIMYDLNDALRLFYEGISKQWNIHAHGVMSTTDLFQFNACGRLLKDISIDLTENNDKDKIMGFLKAMYKIDYNKSLKRAIQCFNKYKYVPLSCNYLNQKFCEALQQYYDLVPHRRMDTDRTVKELIHYGMRIAKMNKFPEITLKIKVKSPYTADSKYNNKFDELLNPDKQPSHDVHIINETVINSYHLIKAISEISTRCPNMHQTNALLYWIALRFIDVEKSLLQRY